MLIHLNQSKILENSPPPILSIRKRFFSGAIWSLLGSIISRGLTIISQVITARLLSSTGFGKLSIIQSTLGVFGVVAGAGLGLSTVKFVSEFRSISPLKAARYISLSQFISVIAGLFTTLVLFFLCPFIASSILDSPLLLKELYLSSALVFFGAINGVQNGAIVGLEKFRMMALMNIIRSTTLIITLPIGSFYYGLSGAVTGLVLSEAISASINYYLLRITCKNHLSPLPFLYFDRQFFSSLLRFSLPAFLSSIIFQPSVWFSNILITRQPNGYAHLGIFTAADKWRQMLLFLPSTLSCIVLPMLSNLYGINETTKFKKVFYANMAANIISVAIPTIGIIIVSNYAMSIFGDTFRNGSMTLNILCASAIPYVFNNILGQVLVSRGLIWWRFTFDFVLSAALAIFSYFLIPIFMDKGIALANLFALSITAMLLTFSVITVFKRTKLNINSLVN